MRILPVDPGAPDPEIIARAAALLRARGLVAFPTETVYGLGADALDAAAVRRIYAAKGRPQHNPIIVHVASVERARDVVSEWNARAERLARAFWPGPLTMVLPRQAVVPDEVTAGLPTVAVRLPVHPVAHALLVATGRPVAAPSANRSMMLSPTTAQHVASSLGDAVDLILDAGPTPVGIESTVVDVSGEQPVLLRPGTISIDQLEAVIGHVARAADLKGDAPRPSPGMLDRHYAPRARVRLVSGEEALAALRDARIDAVDDTTGALLWSVAPPAASRTVVQMPRDAAAYASLLYGTLHALDDAGCETILIEDVPAGSAWDGVRDRLARAAQ